MKYRIRPGVKAFIVHEGKILIVKERIKRKKGIEIMCDVPGGGMEDGETVRQTVIREAKEEVGLDVEVVRPVGCWEWVFNRVEDGEELEVHIVCLGYQCRLVGSPVLDFTHNPAEGDIFEAVWLTKEEILTEGLLRSDDMDESLRNVEL